MTTIKNFCALVSFIALAILFSPNSASAQAGDADGDVVVTIGDIVVYAAAPSEWVGKKAAQPVREGQMVLATHKTDKTQLIAVFRGGKIAQVGTKIPGRNFIALQPSSGAPCSKIHCAVNQLSHCFQTPSGCVCICGSWITLYPGN